MLKETSKFLLQAGLNQFSSRCCPNRLPCVKCLVCCVLSPNYWHPAVISSGDKYMLFSVAGDFKAGCLRSLAYWTWF